MLVERMDGFAVHLLDFAVHLLDPKIRRQSYALRLAHSGAQHADLQLLPGLRGLQPSRGKRADARVLPSQDPEVVDRAGPRRHVCVAEVHLKQRRTVRPQGRHVELLAPRQPCCVQPIADVQHYWCNCGCRCGRRTK